MKIAFVDTVLFIQCKELRQLPWKDLFDNEDLLLIVPYAVVSEIDRHKQDGNTRRAKRGRKASSFFREVVSAKGERLTVRESAPHVELTFAPQPQLDRGKSVQGLDLSVTDNRIVDEALAYAASNPEAHLVFLTHDTGPMLTAKRCGLEVFIIPDGWLLPPEPDQRDKRIMELERKVGELERSAPQIELTVRNSDKEAVASMAVVVTTYEEFSETKLQELVSSAAERSQIVKEFREDPFSKMLHLPSASLYGQVETKYCPPSQEEITQYTDKQYPEWLDSVRKFFVKLPQNKEYPGRHVAISFILSNSGTVPATNLLVRFEALGGLFFIEEKSEDKSDKDQQQLEFPSPPSPPKGKRVQTRAPSSLYAAQAAMGMFDTAHSLVSRAQALASEPYPDLPAILSRDLHKPRDRNAFYWKEGRSVRSTVWVFECQEFLHKIRPEVFDIDLFIPGDKIRNCAVKCLVTASNLPDPVKITLPINVEFRNGNIKEIAEGILSKSLPLIRLGGH